MPAAAARKPATKRPAKAARTQRNARALERARTAHATKTARTAPATPRRRSGPAARPAPAKPRVARKPVPAKRSVAPIARVAQGGTSLFLDGILRGRAWVFVIGVLLAGIVFLNVSVLELNRGIASTSAKTDELERSNSRLRDRVARLDSAERIQRLAEARGFVLPQPGDVTYLEPRPEHDAKLAVARIQPPASEEPPVPVAAPVEPVAAPVEPVAAPVEPAAAAPVAAPVEPVTPVEPVAATTTP
jgi:cell division protein FtsB